MKPDKLALILLIAVSLQLASCNPSTNQAESRDTADDANVIARVENETITLQEVQKEMRYRGGHIPGRFASLESREALLNEIIHFEVLAQKAKAAGYENDPEIKAAVKKMMVKKFKQDYLEKLLHKQRVTDRDVESYYQKNLQKFTIPEMFRPAVISIKFGNQDNQKIKIKERVSIEKARKQAISQKSKFKDFGQLARRYSDDPRTKYRGGAMNWIAKGAKSYQLEKEVLEALFQMKKSGEISPVIETGKGFYLVKLINKRSAEVREFKTVKDQIKRSLIAKKQKAWLEQYYQEARNDFEVSVNRQRLEAMPAPERFANSGIKPPAFPVN